MLTMAGLICGALELLRISSRVRAVAAGGMGLMHQMVQAIGLDRKIDHRVHLLRFHAPHEESDHVLNIAFNSLAGGAGRSKCLALTKVF